MTTAPVAAAPIAPPRRNSFPNYRWPEAWMSRVYAPYRYLAAGVFHSARWLGRIASLINRPRQAIAIIRTDGAGDAILFEPFLRALRRRFDEWEIDLWAPAGARALFRIDPSLANVFEVPRGYKDGNARVFWSLIWRARLGYRLGRQKYDLAILPADDPEPLATWLLAWIRADERWLNAGSTLNQFDWQREWSHAFATRLLEPRKGGHEFQRAAKLAEQCDVDMKDICRPRLTLDARATTYAAVQLGTARHAARRARAGGLVGVIPAGSSDINRYPVDRWADALRQIWADYRQMPAFVGGPEDAEAIHRITQLLGDVPFHIFPPDPDFAVAAAVVSRLDGLISVDTGLAHAATAFDVPTVVLATGGMPGRFWPWPGTSSAIVLTKPVKCASCNYRCIQDSATCVTEIEPRQVADALLRAMCAPSPQGRSKNEQQPGQKDAGSTGEAGTRRYRIAG